MQNKLLNLIKSGINSLLILSKIFFSILIPFSCSSSVICFILGAILSHSYATLEHLTGKYGYVANMINAGMFNYYAGKGEEANRPFLVAAYVVNHFPGRRAQIINYIYLFMRHMRFHVDFVLYIV
jgi:hypothetical protein